MVKEVDEFVECMVEFEEVLCILIEIVSGFEVDDVMLCVVLFECIFEVMVGINWLCVFGEGK